MSRFRVRLLLLVAALLFAVDGWTPAHAVPPQRSSLALREALGHVATAGASTEDKDKDQGRDKDKDKDGDKDEDDDRDDRHGKARAWTVADLLGSPTPFALGHRGLGMNLGEDPSRPLENTVEGFRRAFKKGIRVVELDLQMTADGDIVVFHDDFLEGFTCINALTYRQLREHQPQVPLFRSVLRKLRRFSHSRELSGIIFAEIKVPVPLCDDANTSEQAVVSESALVAAVVSEIRRARMEDQVIINAGSPTILRQAALQAPEIERVLSLNVLQLLPPEVVADIVHLPVVLIPKNDFGLAWYNVGPIARLPAMPSFQGFVGIAIATGSAGVSVDKQVFLQAGAAAPNLVAALHGAGLETIVWTVDDETGWDFVADAGADGITTNNIPLGLANQASISSWALAGFADEESQRVPLESVPGPRLMLYPPLDNPSRNGTVRTAFVLPDRGPAQLSLLDIAGRMIESHDVGTLGPGRHDQVLGRSLPPGIYWVRLTRAAEAVHAKAIVAP